MPDVLVATPGRLQDHMENHKLRNPLQNLSYLIFDEADQLLDQGFRPAITKIMNMLPPKSSRQTLLFSATMPPNVMEMARFALREDFQHVDCVGEEKNTHDHVVQHVVIHSLEAQMAELRTALMEGMQADPDYKILVFFTTARLTQAFAELFNAMSFKVLEIHSRKSQSQRGKASAAFRTSTQVIMFTSDVSARGMDYPDVTRVIQVGLPANKAQYIHRLGRTARAGKAGDGVLLLADFESRFVKELLEFKPVMRAPMEHADCDRATPIIHTALRKVPERTLSMAYQAWLGFYKTNLRKLGWSPEELVQRANSWATECLLLDEPPALLAKTVGMMGLKNVPGVRVEGPMQQKMR